MLTMGDIGGMGCSDAKNRWRDIQGGYQTEPGEDAALGDDVPI